jgi:hypothetical protein
MDAAFGFYRANLAETSERHARWAASHYRSAAVRRGGKFWNDRASCAEPDASPHPRTLIDARLLSTTCLMLSEDVEFVDLPCIDSEFVATKSALRHPRLERPVAYLGGTELTPLMRYLPAGLTPLEIAQLWFPKMSLRSALAIVTWLMNNGILVRHLDVSATAGGDDFDQGLAQINRT